MAYNQSFHQPVKTGLISTSSSSSNVLALSNNNSQKSSKYGELSSSGAGSWVVFSPSVEEDEEEEGDEVLSTTNEYDDEDDEVDDDNEIASSVDVMSEQQRQQDMDDDDDTDSLIDSLDTAHGLRLSLPTHDGSGNFMNQYNEHDDGLDVFNQDLSKEEFITNRIDNWRREQAKVLIEELHQNNNSSSSLTQERSHVDDLLASWGVDDRDPIDSGFDADHKTKNPTSKPSRKVKTTKDNLRPYKPGPKRFYGDDIFGNYSEWEVSMIKKVAQQLSSSLVRDRRGEANLDISTGLRSRRSSLLSNLSKTAINNYLMNTQSYFWQKDLSSAHSSISTTSMMFGNSWGDVM